MAQTTEGAAKITAAKAGVSLEEFHRRRARGEKWCYRCRKFKRARDSFAADRARSDGRKAVCKACVKERYDATYQKKARPGPFGPKPKPGRDGDKRQARARVNILVKRGQLPRPNTLPCDTCGHVWQDGDAQHEYHHHKGYAAAHHLDVIPLCNPCHRRSQREEKSHGGQDEDSLV